MLRKHNLKPTKGFTLIKDGKAYTAEYDGHNLTVLRHITQEPEPQPQPRKSLMERLQTGKMKPKETEKKPTHSWRDVKDGSKSGRGGGAGEALKIPKLDDTVFRSKLSSIMNDNMYDRLVKNRKRGKLDLTSLHKIATNSENVFAQKQARKNKKYNVVLLVDTSGSMRNMSRGATRIQRASQSATYLAKNLVGLNVDLAVVTFNHYVRVEKGFDDVIADYDELEQKIRDRVDGGSGCNHDYASMEYAYSLFRGRKGKNILIMLSDGEPAPCEIDKEAYDNPSGYGVGNKRTDGRFIPVPTVHPDNTGYNRGISEKTYHTLVKKHKDTTSLSLGIQSTAWQMPIHERVDDLEGIKKALLNMLSKQIKRG